MSDPGDLTEHLERLASLHAAGALTDEEFEAEKSRALAQSSPDEIPVAATAAPDWRFAGMPKTEHLYPVTYEVTYPASLSRWKTLLRLPLLIPALLFFYVVQAALFYGVTIGWTTVFWRKKYPRWLFAGVSGALAYIARFQAYALLQTDKYPSFDLDSSPVALTFADPPSGELSRWRVFLWKLVLLIPHFFVLGALQAALFVVTVIAWFAILFTGNYPRGLFGFATGVMRWHYRVAAYFFSLNDRYPPYALSGSAGPSGNKAVVWSGIGGGILAAGIGALFVAAVLAANTSDKQQVAYAALLQGQAATVLTYDQTEGRVLISLNRAYDPGNDLAQILTPGTGEKVVVFEWTIRNAGNASIRVPGDAAELKYNDGETHRRRPAILVIGSGGAPRSISAGATATVRAAFVVPGNSTPLALDFKSSFTGFGGITYEFR